MRTKVSDLYKRLEEYGNSDYYPFHMPGHKRTKEKYFGEILESAYSIDITEIDGFDNLHQAEGILKKAQQDAARMYGADETFFLVNGSTCGILSAICTATSKGGRLLMARNCHRSVYHAVYLQELEVTYLYPDLIKEYGIADAVKPDRIEQSLQRQPEIEAVLITSPTYEGVTADIARIAEIVHKYNKILIVDEAHGAHFGFQEDFPENAVRQGADLVIHSVHKTLPAMTQTALLHVKGQRVNRESLRRYLKIFQTSSPSYVLMASIDSCLNMVQKEGKKRLGSLINRRNYLIRKTKVCRHLAIAGMPDSGDYALKSIDPGKLVIYVRDGKLTGQELYDILRQKYHLQMEMAAGNYVLAILSIMDDVQGMERLAQALLEIDKALDTAAKGKCTAAKAVIYAENVMTIAEAIKISEQAGYDRVSMDQALGRIAAEFIDLYPPGIPLIVPGEKISKETIKLIETNLYMNLNIQGMEDRYIKVVK